MDLMLGENVVVVTGGASGIGLAAAKLFHAEGAKVVVWDLNPPEETSFSSRRVDITSSEEVEQTMQATLEEYGRIDHLVHAAAIGSGKYGFPFDNLVPEDWSRVLEVNVMGMTRIAHAVGPQMRQQKSGTMVFLASVAGQMGSQTDPPYSAAKAANINFAQCLAKDLAPHGVRVNTVCPGMIPTPLNRSVWQAWNDRQPEELKKSYDQWASEKIAAMIPLNRWQSAEDVANAILFLSSERAAQITGQTINVDGGCVMHS